MKAATGERPHVKISAAAKGVGAVQIYLASQSCRLDAARTKPVADDARRDSYEAMKHLHLTRIRALQPEIREQNNHVMLNCARRLCDQVCRWLFAINRATEFNTPT
jgi:hypothetical protein